MLELWTNTLHKNTMGINTSSQPNSIPISSMHNSTHVNTTNKDYQSSKITSHSTSYTQFLTLTNKSQAICATKKQSTSRSAITPPTAEFNSALRQIRGHNDLLHRGSIVRKSTNVALRAWLILCQSIHTSQMNMGEVNSVLAAFELVLWRRRARNVGQWSWLIFLV